MTAYVRRKNAKKGCPFCGGTDHRIYPIGRGMIHIDCRTCHAGTVPGFHGWETWEQIYASVFGE
jgi:hypothetical protein